MTMPAVEIEDLYCRDCENRGVLIVDQFGHCTVCASINVVRWEDMSAKERREIEAQ
jgi:hypothetical protein